jgi:HEAT repeat protein
VIVLTALLILAQSAEERAADKVAEKAANEAVAAFEKNFKGDEFSRLAAIDQVAKVHHLKTANRLAGVLAGMQSSQVRTAAVKALGGFTLAKKSAATVLSNALPSHTKEPGLFSAICDAMVELKEPTVVPTLVKYFEDKEEPLAVMAMTAAGRVGSSAAIDPLIAVVAHAERVIRAAANAAGSLVTDPATGKQYYSNPEVRARDRFKVLGKAANTALQELTKESNITTSDGWAGWWSRNKATFDRK